MFDMHGEGPAICDYCGDKPGGCMFCAGMESERARARVIDVRVHMEMQEAYRCCLEILNEGKPPLQPARQPDRDMVAFAAEVLTWKRRQDAKAAAVAPAPIETAEEATAGRFGKIEWDAKRKARPLLPRASRRIDV